MLWWQSQVVMSGTGWPAQPKMTAWHFTDNVCRPWSRPKKMFHRPLLFYFLKNQVSNGSYVFLERQRCALWIKKLCEPSGTGAGIMGRKNRNLYAKLLLHMLKRGVLEGPFTHRPEPGTLKTLPSYMVGVTYQEVSQLHFFKNVNSSSQLGMVILLCYKSWIIYKLKLFFSFLIHFFPLWRETRYWPYNMPYWHINLAIPQYSPEFLKNRK